MRTSRSPTTVMTANGEVQTREEVTVYVKELDLFVTVMLLEETPAVLPLGKLCAVHGHWTSCQKPHLTKKGKRINCSKSNYVPFVVPGSSTSSSTTPTPASSSSSTQDSVFDENRYTQNPVPERSGISSEELRGNLQHEPTETENKNQNDGHEEVQSDLLHELPGWLQVFRENLIDESSPTEPRRNSAPKDRDTASSSHELPMESRAKVEPGSGKHSVHTHFPKDRNCDICLRTKITRASCRRRAGTVVPRAEILVTWWQQITKFSVKKVNRVTIIDMQSWYNNTHAKQNFPGDPEEPNEVAGANEKTQSHLHRQFFGIWQVLWGIILESLYVDSTQIRNKWDCRKSSVQSERRDICGIVAVRSGQRMVGGFHGVLLPSAKHSRALVWWEDTIRKAVRNAI